MCVCVNFALMILDPLFLGLIILFVWRDGSPVRAVHPSFVIRRGPLVTAVFFRPRANEGKLMALRRQRLITSGSKKWKRDSRIPKYYPRYGGLKANWKWLTNGVFSVRWMFSASRHRWFCSWWDLYTPTPIILFCRQFDEILRPPGVRPFFRFVFVWCCEDYFDFFYSGIENFWIAVFRTPARIWNLNLLWPIELNLLRLPELHCKGKT